MPRLNNLQWHYTLTSQKTRQLPQKNHQRHTWFCPSTNTNWMALISSLISHMNPAYNLEEKVDKMLKL
eukprot:6398188-Ditylum_brightwellii.AAC.1